MNKIFSLSEEEKAYIGGFLDGDGSLNVQIVRRKRQMVRTKKIRRREGQVYSEYVYRFNYCFNFQIIISLTFFQKRSTHWFILWLHKKLQSGEIRKKVNGGSQYTIDGPQNVEKVLEQVKPYLKIKRKQVILTLEILKNKSKSYDHNSFLKCCQLVDNIAALNDSKKRKINSAVVRSDPDFFD